MKSAIILRILGELYQLFLRELIQTAVTQSEAKWDDQVIVVLDALFGYSEPTPGVRGI